MKSLMQCARLRFSSAEIGDMIYEGREIDGVLICETATRQFMDVCRQRDRGGLHGGRQELPLPELQHS